MRRDLYKLFFVKEHQNTQGNHLMTMIKAIFFVPFFILIFFGSRRVASAGDQNALAASFVFGDSLVDAGNNNYLQTLSRANSPPNGIDFKPSRGNPTGRFTNGRTIADIVGNLAKPYNFRNITQYLDFCSGYYANVYFDFVLSI